MSIPDRETVYLDSEARDKFDLLRKKYPKLNKSQLLCVAIQAFFQVQSRYTLNMNHEPIEGWDSIFKHNTKPGTRQQ